MSFSREVGAMVLAAVCIFCAGCDRKATISEAEGNSSVSPVENVSVQETLETGYITSSEITDNDYDSVESVDTKQSEIQNDTLLDRSVSFDKDKTRDEEYINRPMFLGQPERAEEVVYVICSDQEWENNGEIADEYVIISHDGVEDIMPAV